MTAKKLADLDLHFAGDLVARPLIEMEQHFGRYARVLRYQDFSTITRSATLTQPTLNRQRFWQELVRLLGRAEAGIKPARLIGIQISSFDDPTKTRQLSFDLPIDLTGNHRVTESIHQSWDH